MILNPPGSVFLIPWFAPIRQSKYTIFYMQAVFFTDTGFVHGKGFMCFYYLSWQRPSGIRLAFNFSDRFREVFQFYLTRFLNGIDLYNIFYTLDFKIIPKSLEKFVLWYYPPGSVFLIPSFAPVQLWHVLYNIICRLFLLTLAILMEKTSCIISLNKDLQENIWLLTFLTEIDRFREVFEFLF